MAEHIYHATATLAELGLAMAIGTITKIFPQPAIVDRLSRETTENRLKEDNGRKTAYLLYCIGGWFDDFLGKISRLIPIIVFLSEMAVLGGMAFSSPPAAIPLFIFALVGLILMMAFVYFHRETLRETGHHPIVEPVE